MTKLIRHGLPVLITLAAANVFAEPGQAAIALRNPAGDGPVQRVSNVLRARIQARCGTPGAVVTDAAQDAALIVELARLDGGADTVGAWKERGVVLPGGDAPYPESFALKTLEAPAVVALVGADARGVLYGAGELLHRLHCSPAGVALAPVDVASAPAFRFRGFSANQGGTMRAVTKARSWTGAEWQDYVLDFALAGANCFYASGSALDFVKGFDLMAVTGCRPNELGDVPEAWKATEHGRWACPSVPEARRAMLERWEREFAGRGDYDILRFYAGDPGGCRCARCMPWGKTFILLCEEVAAIWLEHHPDAYVLAANQDVTNAGDQAIFDYLAAAPRPWLYGLAYGPGSNAMSDYFRSELRDDLFVYPGCGPVNRYLAETLNQLPKEQCIVHYSDITHWISAQYEVAHPDPYVKAYYGRRTFHARPKAFYEIFQRIMPFSEGDIIYSEGYHDEFHQYMWSRLLWNPNRTLDDVTLEYCRLHFGEEAAEPMKEALYQLEQNLEAPFASNPGIARYDALVTDAGARMPAHVMAGNWRWRLHKQKAALDVYLQQRAQRAAERAAAVKRLAALALESERYEAALVEARALLEAPLDTPAMTERLEEARRLGEETNQLYGVCNVGCFSAERQFRDLFSLERRVREGLEADSRAAQAKALEEIAAYQRRPGLSPIMGR